MDCIYNHENIYLQYILYMPVVTFFNLIVDESNTNWVRPILKNDCVVILYHFIVKGLFS